MILIFSNEADISTNDVIDWLQKEFLRIGYTDFISELSILINEELVTLVFKKEKKLNDIFSFWYRRDDLSLQIITPINYHNFKSVQQICNNEFIKLKDFLFSFFELKKSLGSYKKENEHNKIIALFWAKKIGLSTPITLISSLKSDINTFQIGHIDVISKAIGNMFSANDDSFHQNIGTHFIDCSNIEILNNSFFPTLLQKKIEKIFELRIFYIDKQFYPMAIFSQNDEKTQLDYRNYNKDKPNRNIPYLLPMEIQNKLQLLMNKLDLNTGSIDMIVAPLNEYIFLEVNPVGQFGWLSENCNYYLEEKIAHYLSTEI